MISPGRESTEHARSMRAEVLGVLLAVAGGYDALGRGGVLGLGLVAAGSWLVGHVAASYARGRSELKASAVRPRVGSAPR